MMLVMMIDWHCQVCCPTRHCVLIVAPTRIALTLFVYRRPYSTTCSTSTTYTACRVELAHLAQLELVLIVAPTRIAVTLFVIH